MRTDIFDAALKEAPFYFSRKQPLPKIELGKNAIEVPQGVTYTHTPETRMQGMYVGRVASIDVRQDATFGNTESVKIRLDTNIPLSFPIDFCPNVSEFAQQTFADIALAYVDYDYFPPGSPHSHNVPGFHEAHLWLRNGAEFHLEYDHILRR